MQLDLLSWRPAELRPKRTPPPAPAEMPVSRRLALPAVAKPARGRRPDRKAARALIAAQAPGRVEP